MTGLWPASLTHEDFIEFSRAAAILVRNMFFVLFFFPLPS